jgi:imidazoleglycerol-phosphate dehydratase/histidinol-phosphatase
VADYLIGGERKAEIRRATKETDVYVSLDLDGHGKTDI